ncbi:MAG: thioredoxin [Phaeodactylibacter sp.]|nr:thioredoxin [Phaeodactylibacter sp.]
MDFKTEVIEKSHIKPVVVDFWAPWCGPCRILGPVIEKLAAEQQEKWELVKLNTEEDYDIAEQYNIRSIPNVKMFYKGEVVSEFMGAIPRTAIERWLEQNLPDNRKESLSHILSRLNGEGALSELEAFVAQNPDVAEARVALAREIVYNNPERAAALVETIRLGDRLADNAEDLRTLAELMAVEADDSPAGQRIGKAQQALKNKDNETAIQNIIEAATADKSYGGDLPRRAAIALFRLWGPQDELTKDYRWKFDMALY